MYGEKIVLRILSGSATILSAEDLGFYGYNLDCYKELIDITQGIILVSGPTGSGKSTTLQAIMGALNTEEVNITTLEDPVEANIKGINQVQINTKTGLTFANGLRSILRQDPDIITVGEIRDAETADISMRSAMTGHIVLSTLHTMNAINVITRLEDIDVDAYIIADALKGVLAQRLVRRVCPTCKEEYTPTEAELARINLKPSDPRLKGAHFVRGKGCPNCMKTGYRGRIALPEVLMISPEIQEAIHTHATEHEIFEIACKQGFLPMQTTGQDLVLKGITSIPEINRVLSYDD